MVLARHMGHALTGAAQFASTLRETGTYVKPTDVRSSDRFASTQCVLRGMAVPISLFGCPAQAAHIQELVRGIRDLKRSDFNALHTKGQLIELPNGLPN